MALKAGYVGVKRWIWEKINNVIPNSVSVDNPLITISEARRSEGITNMMPYIRRKMSLSTGSVGAATYTNDNDAYMYYAKIEPGKTYFITRNGSTDANKRFTIALSAAEPAHGGACRIIFANADYVGYKFTAGENDNYVSLYCGKNLTDTDIQPMLRYGNDPDGEYIPFAYTNYQLTELMTGIVKADTFSGTTSSSGNLLLSSGTSRVVLAAQAGGRIVIPYSTGGESPNQNAHVQNYDGTAVASTAVTGTYYYIEAPAQLPATRSAAPDTREASPEVIEDDPEPVTKTTKSSTKKITTKEGE